MATPRKRLQVPLMLHLLIIKTKLVPASNRKRKSAPKLSGRVTNAAQKRSAFLLPLLSPLNICPANVGITRCDVLPDTDPPLCAHCKQYNYDCTFFLPIQETRFKKKRQEEESALQLHGRSYGSGPSTERREPQVDVRTYGPTSIPFMINSTANLHISSLDGLQPRNIWGVIFAGDGYIKVSAPTAPSTPELPSPIKAPDVRVERDIVERLINSYFTNIAPIFPVITKSEFVAFQPNPPPILLYSICLMAASLRDTPRGLFDLFRKTVSSLMRSEDVLSTPTMANIQALLILSMSGDCHGTQTSSLMSFAWTRTGTAIRMAQDLNLHRAEAIKEGTETRRRVWATYSAAFGYPQMIDLTDCDVRLPTPQDQVIGYLNALTRLSILLGEVLKAIYSPTGLFSVTDTMLHDILSRLDHWKVHLPEDLTFKGPDSGPAAGLLHVLYTCVCMIFWRVFMRISFICPPHLQFALNVAEWNRVIENSRAAIQWFEKHDIYWDSWFATSYSLVSCALCQYHTWSRRKDQAAVDTLRLLRDAVKRWESTAAVTEHIGRAKTGEILGLLYEVTQSPQRSDPPHVLGPTIGVRERSGNVFDTLTFRKDSETGGAYVTSDPKVADQLKELPQGLIITEPNTPSGSVVLDDGARKSADSGQRGGPSRNGSIDGQGRPLSTSYGQDSNDSMQAVHSSNASYSQQSMQPSSSASLGLEGVPGNMFDW
ncbi:hypothetical protein FRC17_002765, partial [Serendipita sp. 399]